MHELSLTSSILNTALKYARQTNSQKIVTVVLRLGALRDIQKEWLEHYFTYLSKGTAAENAEILVIVDPIVCRCNHCGKEFEIERETYTGETVVCPACAQANYAIISGTAFRIEGIEVI